MSDRFEPGNLDFGVSWLEQAVEGAWPETKLHMAEPSKPIMIYSIATDEMVPATQEMVDLLARTATRLCREIADLRAAGARISMREIAEYRPADADNMLTFEDVVGIGAPKPVCALGNETGGITSEQDRIWRTVQLAARA